MTAVDDAVTSATSAPPFAPVSATMTRVEAPVVPSRPSAAASEFAPVAAPRSGSAVPRTVVTPRVTPTLERRRMWERRYRTRLRVTDTVIVLVTTVVTSLVTLGAFYPELLLADPWIMARIPVVAAVTWLVALAAFHTRAAGIVGSDATEYKRVAHASGLAFGLLAIAFVIFQWQGIRSQLLFALPVGLLALLVGRWSWRQWLLRKRRFGHYASRAIVVGNRDDVEYVIRTLQADPRHGYIVVGTTLADDDGDELRVDAQRFAVVGSLNTIGQMAGQLSADTIIVASRPEGDPDFVKRLSWQLEGTAAELVLSSRLADVAGPRISLRQVDGLPLIKVRIPTYEGGRHMLKRALDVAASAAALLLVAPLFPIIALAIWIDNRGPVFFRQLRIGRDGREFRMVKFRSMRTTAEQELAALLDENEGSGPLFKLKEDPRVTRVGRILRKYSLDELPQFWNVLVGDMSVVGPRPPLPSEVTAYDGTVFRRLYIKPGITGLWQVSGRSDLSWEDSVRLDLRYVENWSVMSDLMIMWRTAKVMVAPKGAY